MGLRSLDANIGVTKASNQAVWLAQHLLLICFIMQRTNPRQQGALNQVKHNAPYPAFSGPRSSVFCNPVIGSHKMSGGKTDASSQFDISVEKTKLIIVQTKVLPILTISNTIVMIS